MVNYFGESAKTAPPSVFFPVFVRFVKAYKVRTPCRCCVCVFPQLCIERVWLSLPSEWTYPDCELGCRECRAEHDRDLAASVPQDMTYSPRPNNRKDQLDLTQELQLQCLDWSPPLHLCLSSTASPCPTT